MHYIEVAPIKLIRKDATSFTYHFDTLLPIGTIVAVPIGKQQITGIVIATVSKPSFTTKSVTRIIEAPPLPAALVATTQWMSQYYAVHLSQCLSLLLPAGLTKTRRAQTPHSHTPIRPTNTAQPTTEQLAAISAISNSHDTTHILFGVTGSGKTLVYKSLAQQAYDTGKSALILVPEIALTSQLVDEFRQLFGESVIVAHSQQTEAERNIIWRQLLHAKEPHVIIGPRSALFLPVANVGLIVLDEFHEPSYKQEQQPRYSSLRIATILGTHHQARVVFGSATPPVAELYVAKKTTKNIVELKTTAKLITPPTVTVVDMTKRNNFLQHRFLSDALITSIDTSLSLKKQILIFHNKRGTATTTLCTQCGWIATDPSNDLPLTLHADTHQLTSHLTGYTQAVPTCCPKCSSIDIIHKGIGTKLLEAELRQRYPNATIVRFDKDSEKNNTVATRYKDLYDGSVDIIIGTQMIAKGLDLPQLRTVGVVQADANLALPDYAASERVFQLLAQVVGRVGRHEQPTEVIVQSYQPAHPAILAGISQQYDKFYKHTLAQRKKGAFPPFTYVAKFVCTYKTEAAAIKNSRSLYHKLQTQAHPSTIISKPLPAFYEKVSGGYRWQIIVKSPRRSELIALMQYTPPRYWQYELDPLTLL